MDKHSFDLPFERAVTKDGRPTAVILKSVPPSDPSEHNPHISPIQEVESLANSAGVTVLGAVLQRRRRPHPSTYGGKGKLEELKEFATRKEADLIIVDDPISPGQAKNIEDAVGLRVIDRAELIMDIFASRARTTQAILQVELAQLQYSQSRLKRMWTHLSRQEGGVVGARGPGETQLETDRRMIRHKIDVLKERLRQIEQQIETRGKSREMAFKVALVGYTNAGKSTLMRRLTAADVLVENRLFSTLDTSTRRWQLGTAVDVLLSDTVGFIRNLPASLVASFHATLTEARESDLLLHIVDGSSPQVESDIAVVEETLAKIDCTGRDRLLIFNKIDQMPEEQRIDIQHLLDEQPNSFAVSAVTGQGMEPLINEVRRRASQRETVCEYKLPVTRGDLAARLRELGELIEERYENDGIALKARLTPEGEHRFHSLLVKSGLAEPRVPAEV
ncbi:MAG: GTPase HflX [Planctomycetota bacterium]